MNVCENVELGDKNTLAVKAMAKYWGEFNSVKELNEILGSDTLKNQEKYILGGGSNTLILNDVDGLMLHSRILGKEVVDEQDDRVLLEIGSGENWHELVSFSVNQGFAGIENLALIPGDVGGAPVQNLAAYGHNFSDVFDSLEAVDLETGKRVDFSRDECEFGYRKSVFKNKLNHRMLITKVRIWLNKEPKLDTSYFSIGGRYDSIESELAKICQEPYGVEDTYQAVINIRSRKLPSVKQVPSVGSYFINPVVTKQKFDELTDLIENLQCYPIDQLKYVSLEDDDITEAEQVKIPVGRLLDELGWKGKQIGNCMVYKDWASIITHNGKATGEEILEFADTISNDVKSKFGITLESEVTII